MAVVGHAVAEAFEAAVGDDAAAGVDVAFVAADAAWEVADAAVAAEYASYPGVGYP